MPRCYSTVTSTTRCVRAAPFISGSLSNRLMGYVKPYVIVVLPDTENTWITSQQQYLVWQSVKFFLSPIVNKKIAVLTDHQGDV